MKYGIQKSREKEHDPATGAAAFILLPRFRSALILSPARSCRQIADGRLQLVLGAPSFFYTIYAAYSVQADDELVSVALEGLRSIAASDQQER